MTTVDPGLNLLLTAATPSLYARNAFRLTGLLVTTSTREVARYGDKLKLLLQVGGQAAASVPTLLDSTQVPEPDDLREALQHLRDVRTRTLHEFFWLWPDNWEKPESDAAFAALRERDLKAAKAVWTAREAENGCCIAIHNLAVLGHLRALDLSLQDIETPLQPEVVDEMHAESESALRRWERIADDDSLWDYFKERIAQIDDPAVTTGMVRRLRDDLLRAFMRIMATLAVAYAEQKRHIECEWQVHFLNFFCLYDQQKVSDAVDHALAGVRERLERSLQNIKQHTAGKEAEGIAKAHLLLDTADPLLMIVQELQFGYSKGRDFENIGRAALDAAAAGYTAIYCSKDPSPTVLARQEDRKHAEEFIRTMTRCRVLINDTGLHKTIDSNIRLAEKLLQQLPRSPYPPVKLDPYAPKSASPKQRLAQIQRQRPTWRMLLLHCLRSVPQGVWRLVLIVSLSVGVSSVVNSISSTPVSSGKFTPKELAAFSLPQREGTQSLSDLPASGMLWTNPALRGQESRLLITVPAEAGGTHFCAILTPLDKPDQPLNIFIRNGETADVRLPANVYDMTLTWGTHWNIEEDRFQPPHQRKIHFPGLTASLATVLQVTKQPDGTFDISAPKKISAFLP